MYISIKFTPIFEHSPCHIRTLSLLLRKNFGNIWKYLWIFDFKVKGFEHSDDITDIWDITERLNIVEKGILDKN